MGHEYLEQLESGEKQSRTATTTPVWIWILMLKCFVSDMVCIQY